MSNGSHVLTYFNIPGRGESVRLMLTLGGSEFENKYIPLPIPLENPAGVSPAPFDDGSWGILKPNTPWGTLPTLTLPDGRTIGQQRSILRFLAKQTTYQGKSLYPSDPYSSAVVDGFMDMLEDIWPILLGDPTSIDKAPLYSTLMGLGVLYEFLEPRMEVGSGDLAMQFDFLEKAISDEGVFITGDDLSCADILLFAAIPWWGAGVFGSMEPMLRERPKIERVINAVAALEPVTTYYSTHKAARANLPKVGSTDYSDYYKYFHSLCGIA